MDLPVLIVLAVVCVAIGFVLDNLFHSLREGQVEKPAKPAAEETPAAQEASEPAPSPLESVSLEEVLRIWRKPPEQALIVEVSGRKAHSPTDLDQAQLDLLGATLQKLSAWLGQGMAPAALETPPALQPAPGETALESLALPEQAGEGYHGEKVKPLSLNPILLVTNALRADVQKPVEMKSLATQVDEVLQEKLKGTPLEKRGIQLVDGPDKGLLVRVGMEKYPGVEEVPDAEIREMIHAAVVEWGKRVSPAK
jgi:hypothetical protein